VLLPPWSRGGDGRFTLKGGVREVIAAQALHRLGVTTSRSLSLVETGEGERGPGGPGVVVAGGGRGSGGWRGPDDWSSFSSGCEAPSRLAGEGPHTGSSPRVGCYNPTRAARLQQRHDRTPIPSPAVP